MLEDWDPEAQVKPIWDPKSWTDQGQYSAPGPESDELWPDKSSEYNWEKLYCWESEESQTRNEMDSLDWTTIAVLSILFPYAGIPAALVKASGGYSGAKKYKVKQCMFRITDSNGKEIAVQPREVDREDITPVYTGGNDINPMSMAWAERVDTGAYDTDVQKTSDELQKAKSTESKRKVVSTFLDNVMQDKPEGTKELRKLTLYAADIKPNDVEEYFLVPRTAANPAGGYFTKVGIELHKGDVISGKELLKYTFLRNININREKFYKVESIVPNSRRWRYLGDKTLGILPFSMVDVSVILQE